jgi:hypothetical protein
MGLSEAGLQELSESTERVIRETRRLIESARANTSLACAGVWRSRDIVDQSCRILVSRPALYDLDLSAAIRRAFRNGR